MPTLVSVIHGIKMCLMIELQQGWDAVMAGKILRTLFTYPNVNVRVNSRVRIVKQIIISSIDLY